nr:hypothetical protein GCM10023233_00650 [Brevibacterium otitidis]BFF08629.1 hypothetical protein GCM10023233_35980 [Brevibacterium otitidis]
MRGCVLMPPLSHMLAQVRSERRAAAGRMRAEVRMELYVIRSTAGASSYGLMATDGEYCFVYSPNTGLWHRSHECEMDFVFDRESVYEEVDAVTAERLRQKIQPLDRRTMRWYLNRLEKQAPEWKRTSAEVGLPSDTRRTTPTTADGE